MGTCRYRVIELFYLISYPVSHKSSFDIAYLVINHLSRSRSSYNPAARVNLGFPKGLYLIYSTYPRFPHQKQLALTAVSLVYDLCNNPGLWPAQPLRELYLKILPGPERKHGRTCNLIGTWVERVGRIPRCVQKPADVREIAAEELRRYVEREPCRPRDAKSDWPILYSPDHNFVTLSQAL